MSKTFSRIRRATLGLIVVVLFSTVIEEASLVASQTRQQKEPPADNSAPLADSTFHFTNILGGSWITPGNWALDSGTPGPGFPNAIGDVATFGSIITAQRGVQIPVATTITVGTMNLQDDNRSWLICNPSPGGTLVFDASAGNAAINVSGTTGHGNDDLECVSTLNDPLVVDVGTNCLFSFFAGIGETGGTKTITKNGAGNLRFSPLIAGTHTFTGATIINNGLVLVNTNLAQSPITLNGGTLSGGSVSSGDPNAKTGPITATGGTVAPGTSTVGISTDILNTSGNVSLNSSTTFAVEMWGTTAGGSPGYDQLNVVGGVTLGTATLSVTVDGAFTPAVGNTFTIINNDSTDAVNGRFAGLPNNGSTFMVGATNFSINYAGGSNSNDVVLTVVAPPQPVTVTATAGTVGPTDYTTLKAAFDAVNAGTHQGVITVTINTNTTETAAATLNASGIGSASYTSLNVHPSVPGVSVAGSIAGDAVVVLNGADNVTIDGSVSGGSTGGVGGNPAIRNLTIQNTSPSGPITGVIAINNGTSGAVGDTIKNVIVLGQDPTQTTVGIGIGAAPAGINPPSGSNNNTIRVENCSIQRAQYGIYDIGISAATQATGHVITRNEMTGTGTNRLRSEGIHVLNQNGIQITENSVGGVGGSDNADVVGINAGVTNVTSANSTSGGISNSLISRNKVNGVSSTGTATTSAVGIALAGDIGENFVQNNMITGVTAPSTGSDLVAGMFIAGAVNSNTHIFYNSISNTGARGATANQVGSYAIAITGSNPVMELKDNIFYNTQTSAGGANAKTYAIGMETSTFTLLSSDFNNFFTSGAQAIGYRTGGLNTAGAGTDITTLATWRITSTEDASSTSVDPLFVDPVTNLHLKFASTMVNAALAIGAVTTDIDGQTRPFGPGPDIGADEIAATAAGVSVSGRVLTSDGRGVTNAHVTITGQDGTTQTIVTGRRGTFVFEDVAAGGTYVLSVSARRFAFEPKVISVTDNVSDIDFTPSVGGMRAR